MTEREDMSDTRLIDTSCGDRDEHGDTQAATDFDGIVDRRISRRGFLAGGVGLGAAAFVMGSTALTAPARAGGRLAFEAVLANTFDTVTLPPGYRWQIVAKWGDPLWPDGVDFDESTRGTGASQETAFGDNNDGMALYAHGDRAILAANNEYVNLDIIYGNRASAGPETAADVRKGKAGHGFPFSRSCSATVPGASSRVRPTTAASRPTRRWRSPGRRAVTIC